MLATDVDIDAARAVSEQFPGSARPHRLDVRSETDWQQSTQAACNAFGKLDIVCNIAGIGIAGSIEDIDLDDWDKMVSINLTGTILGCKIGLKTIVESGGSGAIINMSSLVGLVGPADLAGYSNTKGGVSLLTKSVAMHCAEKRYPVRCVSIHPTYVDTPILEPVAEALGGRDALMERVNKLVPIGRICSAEDVAASVAFAASDEAAMISGSGLVLDGAQIAGLPSFKLD